MRAVHTSVASVRRVACAERAGGWSGRGSSDSGSYAAGDLFLLTAFPPPHRAAPDLVATGLKERFADVLPSPSVADQRALVGKLAEAGRIGRRGVRRFGGLTAKAAGAVLVTADQRALAVYDLVGVQRQLLQ